MSYNVFYRRNNTTQRGGSFSTETDQQVWKKGKVDYSIDSTGTLYRRDTCNAIIRYSDYGNTDSKYGWEIDHIKPVASGGGDDISNLQPLQWNNNRHKGDNWPTWYCAVR